MQISPADWNITVKGKTMECLIIGFFLKNVFRDRGGELSRAYTGSPMKGEVLCPFAATGQRGMKGPSYRRRDSPACSEPKPAYPSTGYFLRSHS